MSTTSPSVPTRIGRSRWAGLAAAAATLGLALAASTAVAPASAHDELVSSSPAAGDALDPAPGEITLTFSDNILEVGAEVSVTDDSGAQWVADELTIDGPTVTAPLESDMPGGSYVVDWRVVSSDGHPVSGSIPFTVTTPAPAEPTEPTTTATPDASEPPVVATPSDTPAGADDGASPDAKPSGGQIALIAAISLAVLVVIAAIVILLARRRGRDADADSERRTDDL